MDEKISLEAIAVYGDRYAKKVVNGFFIQKEIITGSDILSFCEVHQVNLFIIKELFKTWKEEQEKIRSPFFDFENKEVKEAMEALMNLLSKNIAIDKEHFEPLVRKAVSQALLLIFDPYDFFSMLITGSENRLNLATFKEEIKYLKVNKAPLEKMVEKLEEKNSAEISGNEAFGILDQILEEVAFTPEDIELYIEKFSVVEPLDPNTFFIARNPDPVDTNAFIPEETKTTSFSESNLELVPPPSAPPLQNNIGTPSASPTLNEKHFREPRPTVAENFQRIKKIKESLTINQKFMFTKVLFHGDFELFSKAVDRLDQFDSLQAAIRYIEEEHASTWDRESEEFYEFMELVEKRFI